MASDYVARKDNGQVYEFEELAASSGLDNEKGIKRLGVLRADVDILVLPLVVDLFLVDQIDLNLVHCRVTPIYLVI